MEGHDTGSSSVVDATLVLGPLTCCHDPDVDQGNRSYTGSVYGFGARDGAAYSKAYQIANP